MMFRIFLGAVRLQLSEILIERKGDEAAIGIREAINEGKQCHVLEKSNIIFAICSDLIKILVHFH